MEIGAITAQDEAYLPREKKQKQHTPTLNQWRSEQPVPHWCERKSLLILLQFPIRAFFWVSQLRRERLWCGVHTDYQLACETPRFLIPHTFSLSRAGQQGVRCIQ